MAQRTFSVKLAGKDQLHGPTVRIEGININLFTIDGGETWENKGIKLETNGSIEIHMSCTAISGTGWNFTVKDKQNGATLYTDEGRTGDTGVNFSKREVSINVDNMA